MKRNYLLGYGKRGYNTLSLKELQRPLARALPDQKGIETCEALILTATWRRARALPDLGTRNLTIRSERRGVIHLSVANP